MTNELNEAQVSALVDGELGRHEMIAVIDQLVESEPLRAFYRDVRRLDRLVDEAGSAAAIGELPTDLWDRIERTAAAGDIREQPRARDTRSQWRWGLQVAALVVIAVATWVLAGGNRRQPTTLRPDGGVMSVVLASQPGAMSDGRFLALTTELLQADRHYHEQMFEILQAVRGPNREGGGEGLLPLTDTQPRLQLANAGPAGDRARRTWD